MVHTRSRRFSISLPSVSVVMTPRAYHILGKYSSTDLQPQVISLFFASETGVLLHGLKLAILLLQTLK